MRPFIGSKKLKYASSSVNVYCSGNSITYGYGLASQSLAFPALLATIAPLASAGIAPANLGHNSNTWEDLTKLTDMDAAFVAGKTNVLFAMETVNSIANISDTPAQCIAAVQAYIAARLTAHPSVKIILGTATARVSGGGTYPTTASIDAAIQTVNAAMLAHYRDWGCVACVDMRAPGSPFNGFSTYSSAEFAATGVYNTDDIHWNAAGHVWGAQMIANTLYRLAA